MLVSLKKRQRFYLIDIMSGKCDWQQYIVGRMDLSRAYRRELLKQYGLQA